MTSFLRDLIFGLITVLSLGIGFALGVYMAQSLHGDNHSTSVAAVTRTQAGVPGSQAPGLRRALPNRSKPLPQRPPPKFNGMTVYSI